MADTKISGLPAVTNLLSTDEFVLARSGVTNKIDAVDLVVGLGASTDGWTSDANTWTYVSASTFTVSGDVTAQFSKGTRLKFTQTTVKYAVVVGSSHAAGTTTVTIAVNVDYTIANAAITLPYYSYQASPQGYPGWFAFTPTYGGFSAAPASGNTVFSIVGRECTIIHGLGTGTSNANTFTISLPVTASFAVSTMCVRVYNNSAFVAAGGLFDVAASSATASVFLTGAGGVWTTSNLKAAGFSVTIAF
jgi:hypothetical protein